MKNIFLKIVRVIAFFIVLLIVNSALISLVKDRGVNGWRTWDAFYAQEPDSIDVLFVGSSRVFWNINPAVLWDEYGIASFDLASASQSMRKSYHAVKEAFKTQSPQVVVLEISATDHEDMLADMEYSGFLAGMRMSMNKVELLFAHTKINLAGLSDALFMLPVLRLKFGDITKDTVISTKNMRYPHTGIVGYKGADELFAEGSDDEGDIRNVDEPYSDVHIEYLDRIVALCNKNGAKLLFTNTPMNSGEYNTAIDRYAKEHGIEYLNYIELPDKAGVVPGDFADDVHLYYKGSKKTSSYMGKYLTEQFGIIGHDKDDPAYLSWRENLTYSNQMLCDYEISKITGMGDYFDRLPNENYLLILSLKGRYKDVDQGQKELLHRLKIIDASYELGGTWVIDGEDIIYYIPMDGEDWHMDIGDRTISVENATDASGVRDIYIDNENYAVTDDDGKKIANGMEVIVYDKLAGHVVDAVCFDADRDYGMKRLDIEHVYSEWY